MGGGSLTTAPRILILAIDAANPDLLERWAADGRLPNIARLIGDGVSGRVRGLPGFFIGSTWPSFYTGTNPARHGLHYLVQLRLGHYDFFRPALADQLVRGDPFWRRMSRAGRRVAILDVPLSQLDPELNGLQVVEWGGHDALYGFRTHPAPIAAELLERFGPHPAGPTCDVRRTSAAEYRAFRDGLVRGAHTKARLTRHVMARERWDVLMQVFTEAHCVGHQCWHLHDATHPAHDPALARDLGDPLLDVYQAVDAAIGHVLEGAGADTRVLVCSAHGMEHWYSGQSLLPEILIRLGVARRREGSPDAPNGDPWMVRLARQAWLRLPGAIRNGLRPLRNRVRGADPPAPSWTLGLNPATSACFPVGNGYPVAGLRLNLAGREPAGVLASDEARRFMAQLSNDLLAIRNARTGEPLVSRVLVTADSYQGEALPALPDLLIEWNDAMRVGSANVGSGEQGLLQVHSPKIGTLEAINRYGRTGDHRPTGFFVATGPDLEAARVTEPVSVMDFAPTLEAWTGMMPARSDGEPIAELVSRTDSVPTGEGSPCW